jgi:large subunit ribosomal protein L33
MATKKKSRILVTLECLECRINIKKTLGVSRYLTEKNRINTPERLEFRKYCPNCNQHRIHKEIK